jgi:hypothetical protein
MSAAPIRPVPHGNTTPAISPLRRRSEGPKATPVGISTRADLLLLGLVPDGRVVDPARSLDPLQHFGSVVISHSNHSDAQSTLKPWDQSTSCVKGIHDVYLYMCHSYISLPSAGLL